MASAKSAVRSKAPPPPVVGAVADDVAGAGAGVGEAAGAGAGVVVVTDVALAVPWIVSVRGATVPVKFTVHVALLAPVAFGAN